MDIARNNTLEVWEKNPDTGHNAFRKVNAFVELELDIDGLLKLVAYKALKNKSGKTRYLSGLIKGAAKRRIMVGDADVGEGHEEASEP